MATLPLCALKLYVTMSLPVQFVSMTESCKSTGNIHCLKGLFLHISNLDAWDSLVPPSLYPYPLWCKLPPCSWAFPTGAPLPALPLPWLSLLPTGKLEWILSLLFSSSHILRSPRSLVPLPCSSLAHRGSKEGQHFCLCVDNHWSHLPRNSLLPVIWCS